MLHICFLFFLPLLILDADRMDTNKILGPEVEKGSLVKPQNQVHTLQTSTDYHIRPVLDTFSCIDFMEFLQQDRANYLQFFFLTDEETVYQVGK